MQKSFCAILIAACALIGCAGGRAPNSIKIGWFGPLSGTQASWGLTEFNTVKMMVDDYNAQGGVQFGGRRVKLEAVGYDDMGDAANATNSAKKLIEADKVAAIVGPMNSPEAIAVAPLVDAARTPLVSSWATLPEVTVEASGKVHPYVFRAAFTEGYLCKAAAKYAVTKLGRTRGAILSETDDAFSVIDVPFLKESFVKEGGTIVAEKTFNWRDADQLASLTAIKAAKPDIVFLPIGFKLASIAGQAQALGINGLLFGGDSWPSGGGDEWPSDNLIRLAGTALEGALFVNDLDFSGKEAMALRDEYKAKFQKDPGIITSSYLVHDAMLMLVDAIGRAKSMRGADIAKALEATDIAGITGRIKIGPKHDPVGKDAWIMRIAGPSMVLQERITAE
jgi:branched-chain amino acid transport system substrate-binding protein